MGPSRFSRSSTICVRLRLFLPLRLLICGLAGRGRKAAMNHPGGKMKPITKSITCALLLLGAFPSACSSMLGAWKIVRRLPSEVLSCHRCGDQLGDTFRLGRPLISARSSSLGLTGPIARELLRCCPVTSRLLRVLGRKMLSEILSVDVEGRLLRLFLTMDEDDWGRA